jgi:pyoverdine/dityrosine biosynthesis protein Dit1
MFFDGPVNQVDSTVDRIVEIISSYINKDSPDDQFESIGRTGLRATVARYVENGEQMELIFPAFPFKSASLKKVLGLLPDLGEEILLKRLDTLALRISEVHPAGAVVRLVSDGIVYQR